MKLESYIIKQNVSKKTFTINCYSLNNCYAIYKTLPMNKEDFKTAKLWNEEQWKEFLNTDKCYIFKN